MKTLEEIRRDQDRPVPTPAMGITRLDVPFWDVFCLVFKVFVSWAMLCAIVALLWYILLR